MYLAQYNIAKIRYPLSDPKMSEFVNNIDLVHKIADRMGLIHRVKDETGSAIHMSSDPTILPNLTIWKDVDSLMNFVHKTIHTRFMNKKDEWFLPMSTPKTVYWWCAESYKPFDMLDGELRLQYYIEHGSTNYAFDLVYLQKI